MFQVDCERVLPREGNARYKGIAYDGCSFYLTEARVSRVVQLDGALCIKRRFETVRCYTSLCFDPAECCFWAAAENCNGVIYRLSLCFEELERVAICCSAGGGAVMGISRNCGSGTLMVAFAWGVVNLNPKCPKRCTVFKKSTCDWVVGVLSLCPYTLCHCIGQKGQAVRVYDGCGALVAETALPPELTIEAAVFAPCGGEGAPCRFCVLASRRCGCPCLLEGTLEPCDWCEKLCCCNWNICHSCCGDTHCDCKTACCAVLESVALVEASLAHILNAEGEKLQKVIASTDDVSKLLAVNESVRRTVEQATHLELVLLGKIDAVCDACDFCREDDCSCGP